MRRYLKSFSTRLAALTGVGFLSVSLLYAQQPKKDWEGEGEIEDVTIEIVKERQITLPKANRNFEKIPPRASEPIKPPITYDFQSFNFRAPQINSQVRPLKLKAEGQSRVYGGFLRAGFGNYMSPLLEGYINSTRDKNKLVGAQLYHSSSDKGPVDGKNSGSGSTGISVFGQSFSDAIALSGNVGFQNRTTHFYGYPAGTDVDASAIKQSFDLFKLAGQLSNSKNSDFSYKLGASFSFLKDRYDARETEVGFNFNSAYELDEDQHIRIRADYFIISRKDSQVEAKARNLFTVTPSYQFVVIDDLKLSVGITAAYENDTIDSKKLHFYPDVNASYPLSPSVDAVASLTGGIEKVSLQSLSYDNLWLAPNVPIFHTNKALDFSVGLKARLGNKVAVHTGMSFTSLKNWYYFMNSEDDQSKFDVVYDGGAGTRRANLFAALSYAQSEVAKFMLRGDFYNYGTGSLNEAWHRPTYKLTANGSYNLYDKFIFSADLIAQGGMKAMDPATDTQVKLDAAFDLNFKTEYLFSKSFSAFVQLHNITSNKYPLFLNYPVRGFQLMAGITWSF
ncbi:MAG TPA: hypothetical protein VF141_07935 [Chryseolinea sp.]